MDRIPNSLNLLVIDGKILDFRSSTATFTAELFCQEVDLGRIDLNWFLDFLEELDICFNEGRSLFNLIEGTDLNFRFCFNERRDAELRIEYGSACFFKKVIEKEWIERDIHSLKNLIAAMK